MTAPIRRVRGVVTAAEIMAQIELVEHEIKTYARRRARHPYRANAGRPRAPEPAGSNVLTERQREVLVELAKGKSQRASAEALGIWPHALCDALRRARIRLGLPEGTPGTETAQVARGRGLLGEIEIEGRPAA